MSAYCTALSTSSGSGDKPQPGGGGGGAAGGQGPPEQHGIKQEMVRSMTGLDPWTIGRSQLCSALHRAVRREVPGQDAWRPPYLQELHASRLQAQYSADQEEVLRLDGLINSLVIK